MVRKKVDPRVKETIERGVQNNHRSLFMIVGDYGKDQVENIHRILSNCRVKARPSVLWCYKKDLGFSTHRKKRMKDIKNQQAKGLYDADRDDPFELFIAATTIRWTYYKETEKVMGQTFGMCVLQDFEALTPNILARTIETVEGGGIIILLIKTVSSLKQLYTMSMDVHSRFRTAAHSEVVPRFNERFLLSLSDCSSCLVLDDELNILPVVDPVVPLADSTALTTGGDELRRLQAELQNTPRAGALVGLCRTLDQAKAVMSFLAALNPNAPSSAGTFSLTAGRGRGKSAALGLCLAGAIGCGLGNVFVTAPSPENLQTVFEFAASGLRALGYVNHADFECIAESLSSPAAVSNDSSSASSSSGGGGGGGDYSRGLVTRISVHRATHRQIIQFVWPSEAAARLVMAELIAVDEAAAIPLPQVKALLPLQQGSSNTASNTSNTGNHIALLASTISGYEGTGRALSLKLLQQLRSAQGQLAVNRAKEAASAVVGAKQMKGVRKVHEERWAAAAASFHATNTETTAQGTGKLLTELVLETPIRYSQGCPVEAWLLSLLCLDSNKSLQRFAGALPPPSVCELYAVDRDALFSRHVLAEGLLQRVMALYTAAHYKNSPNDLQMLSDAPAHRLFILLGPQQTSNKSNKGGGELPEVLAVLQVAFEGRISREFAASELAKGGRANGDLIPWTISQQFSEPAFASLSGARVVRIACHPDLQGLGYGSKAVELLAEYFTGRVCVEAVSDEDGIGSEGLPRLSPQEQEQEQEEGDGEAGYQVQLQPRQRLPPLLTPLTRRPYERLHWIGAAFGLTTQLHSFWSRRGFEMVYVRQGASEVTGEHSAILLKELLQQPSDNSSHSMQRAMMIKAGWLRSFGEDCRRRVASLLGGSLRGAMGCVTALAVLDPDRSLTATATATATNNSSIEEEAAAAAAAANNASGSNKAVLLAGAITAHELLSHYLTRHDLNRLELYGRNLADHYLIADLLPSLGRLFFLHQLGSGLRLSPLQAAILSGLSLQMRDIDMLVKELNLPANQLMALFNKAVRKLSARLRLILEAAEEQEQEEERKRKNQTDTAERNMMAVANKGKGVVSLPKTSTSRSEESAVVSTGSKKRKGDHEEIPAAAAAAAADEVSGNNSQRDEKKKRKKMEKLMAAKQQQQQEG